MWGTTRSVEPLQKHAENWVRVLEEDPREIHRAAAEAQRMSDYLIGRVRGRSLGSLGE